ncbi:MAG: Uncharacterised protein [Flavobacteriia bacterium]|nr:MAG: Uncharacterised protein [Flavobacteriia bacterium]
MNSTTSSTRWIFVVALLLLGLFSRFVPHWPNFTALGAVALMGGSQLRPHWLAPLVTFGALIISDLILGFYSGFSMVYLAFLMICIQGRWMNSSKGSHLFGHSLGASTLFFLLTNGAVWYANPMYSQDVSGLILAYAAGLPFFLNFLLGTLAYGFGLSFVLRLVDRKVIQLS